MVVQYIDIYAVAFSAYELHVAYIIYLGILADTLMRNSAQSVGIKDQRHCTMLRDNSVK